MTFTSEMPYLDWVRVHAPAYEKDAEALLEKVRAGYQKPGRFLDDMKRLARGLPSEHLPAFWDSVGRRLAGGAPKQAASAYGLAREAERTHRLPVEVEFRVENALVFARAGALAGKEMRAHQEWLGGVFPAQQAHQEFLRFVRAWSEGGAPPAADLHTRLRASAKAAGQDDADVAQVLGEVLAAAKGLEVPNGLLDGAAKLLAKYPPSDEVRQSLVDLFPPTNSDGAAFLRLLRDSGTIEAVAAGRITPDAGLARWLGHFTYLYSYRRQPYGGVMQYPLPDELYELLPLLAPQLRTSGKPVPLHEGRYRWSTFDADLVDACLTEGVPVVDPGPKVQLKVWGERSRRDLRALAADPVLGRRLESGMHPRRKGGGTAITRLASAPQIADSVRERVARLVARVAHSGLETAGEAVAGLDGILDTPTVLALGGLADELGVLDLARPLLRTLRAGLPDELGWPALDSALDELTAITGCTSTWPVLTLFTADRAIAVDHRGRRAECAFTLPQGASDHVVFYVGGDFLVGWSEGKKEARAYWAGDPESVFTPAETVGMHPLSKDHRAFGFHYETDDGTGRHDGQRVLRPGDRSGIGWSPRELLSDGTGLWIAPERHITGWQEVDPKTGKPSEASSPPAFFASASPLDGAEWADEYLSLARLPDGVTGSPLGQAGDLAGFRVTRPRVDGLSAPGHYDLEGVDGRRARFRRTRGQGFPWGVLRLPDGPDLVLTQQSFKVEPEVHCHDADDGSLLWKTSGFVAPPAFWHFFEPRDPGSSRALRGAGLDTARELLDAARGGEGAVRSAMARVLPEVTEPRIVEGVVAAVVRATEILRGRERISRRVAVVLSGELVRAPAEVPDTQLLPALRGLLFERRSRETATQPAFVTAVAADGRYLDGRIGDPVRWSSRPAETEDWTVLLGRIDAVAWRLLAGPTDEKERPALTALLLTWAEQPFAKPSAWRVGTTKGAALVEPGKAGLACVPGGAANALRPPSSYRFVQHADTAEPDGAQDVETVTIGRDDASRLLRLVSLLDENGPVPFDEAAVEVFVRRTGVRRAVATLVLAGLPRKAEFGTDLVVRHEEHKKMLRAKPFQATGRAADEAEQLTRELGAAGRLRVLAAGMPDDPAELWTDGGMVAAAERMAAEWIGLLGAKVTVDEETAAQLDKDLGLGTAWATALADPASSSALTHDVKHELVASRYGDPVPHVRSDEGWKRDDAGRYATMGAALIWALTQRPVGHPGTAGAAELHDRLRARLDNPDLFLRLGVISLWKVRDRTRELFGPRTIEVRPARDPANDRARDPLAYDDGLLIIDGQVHLQSPLVRPAAFGDPGSMERITRLCVDYDLPGLLLRVRQFKVLYDDGLARMVARAADTPVPPGGYEANPLLSVPDLVDEVSTALRASTDAAALYLQLRTLSRPTDRNIRTWNGWKAARHKAAQAELVERGAVVQEKRPRAGRTAFLPGDWTQVKSPHLPLETYKLDLHLAAADSRKEIDAPVTRLLPPRPLHEMFADAWQGR